MQQENSLSTDRHRQALSGQGLTGMSSLYRVTSLSHFGTHIPCSDTLKLYFFIPHLEFWPAADQKPFDKTPRFQFQQCRLLIFYSCVHTITSNFHAAVFRQFSSEPRSSLRRWAKVERGSQFAKYTGRGIRKMETSHVNGLEGLTLIKWQYFWNDLQIQHNPCQNSSWLPCILIN